MRTNDEDNTKRKVYVVLTPATNNKNRIKTTTVKTFTTNNSRIRKHTLKKQQPVSQPFSLRPLRTPSAPHTQGERYREKELVEISLLSAFICRNSHRDNNSSSNNNNSNRNIQQNIAERQIDNHILFKSRRFTFCCALTFSTYFCLHLCLFVCVIVGVCVCVHLHILTCMSICVCM